MSIRPPFCVPSGPDVNCGWNIGVSSSYWISFQVITSIVLVNLIAAVVLEAFAESQNNNPIEHGVFRLTQHLAELYSKLWARLDPSRTMFLQEQEVCWRLLHPDVVAPARHRSSFILPPPPPPRLFSPLHRSSGSLRGCPIPWDR
jgi:hypothetical protein